MSKEHVSSGGIGIAGVLTLIFLVLKLTDNIDWSWWWVFSPLWISAIIGAIIIGVVFLVIYLSTK